jgi:hypothetical protein
MCGADIPDLSELEDRENKPKKKENINGNDPENPKTILHLPRD